MDGLEWTASALNAAEDALTVATRNLAGASSDGFHRTMLLARCTGHGIVTRRVLDATPGVLHRTGRDLDIAVEGPARIRLTDGSLRHSISCERGVDGSLRTESGALVAGMRGVLRLPLQAHIEADGSVVEFGRVVDRVALTQAGRLQTGVVEAANTDSLHAMIEVLEAQRRFETAQKTTQMLDSVAAKDASETGRAAQ
jgi:flagellar basal body rod protein FlgG